MYAVSQKNRVYFAIKLGNSEKRTGEHEKSRLQQNQNNSNNVTFYCRVADIKCSFDFLFKKRIHAHKKKRDEKKESSCIGGRGRCHGA
jgi:hypothetical protein